jgi:hypothetical protein
MGQPRSKRSTVILFGELDVVAERRPGGMMLGEWHALERVLAATIGALSTRRRIYAVQTAYHLSRRPAAVTAASLSMSGARD